MGLLVSGLDAKHLKIIVVKPGPHYGVMQAANYCRIQNMYVRMQPAYGRMQAAYAHMQAAFTRMQAVGNLQAACRLQYAVVWPRLTTIHLLQKSLNTNGS